MKKGRAPKEQEGKMTNREEKIRKKEPLPPASSRFAAPFLPRPLALLRYMGPERERERERSGRKKERKKGGDETNRKELISEAAILFPVSFLFPFGSATTINKRLDQRGKENGGKKMAMSVAARDEKGKRSERETGKGRGRRKQWTKERRESEAARQMVC